MDRDITLIEAVRKEPCLYVDNFNIEERNKGWKQLSEKLKMKDQHLKIRWHLLVQRYQSDDSFKYAQQMDFVERKSQNKIEKASWPEFEITEEDMLETRRNSEEYVFLDVDDLEDNSSTEPRVVDVKEEIGDDNDDKSDECHDSPSLISPNVLISGDSKKCDKTPNTPDIVPSNLKQKEKIPNKLPINDQPTPEPVAIVEETSREVANSKPTTERSEDDIFGELVAAMLKRMEADKKRMVKKEIMNMLLT